MATIEEILKKRNIEAKPSHFLVKYQSNMGKQQFFDPKDKFGQRLSKDWISKDDTIFSVGLRKLGNNLSALLNPDTYSALSIPAIKHWMIVNQNFMILTTFIISVPLIFVLTKIAPSLRRARKQYVLHQYMRRRYFQQQFKLNSKRISRRQVQDILKQTHSRINV